MICFPPDLLAWKFFLSCLSMEEGHIEYIERMKSKVVCKFFETL